MQPPDALPTRWQRLLALSGVVFAVLFLIGWFASGGDAPDHGAPDQDWTSWADDSQWNSRVAAFAMLLAGFVFLHFAATIRTVLGRAETSLDLARAAFAGAVTGMAGMTWELRRSVGDVVARWGQLPAGLLRGAARTCIRCP